MSKIILLACLFRIRRSNQPRNDCECDPSCLHGTDLFHYRCGIGTE